MNDKLELEYETRTDVRLCVDIGFGEPQGIIQLSTYLAHALNISSHWIPNECSHSNILRKDCLLPSFTQFPSHL